MGTTVNSNSKGGVSMTKAELISKMAAGAKISKAAAGKALEAFLDGVKASLKKEDRVTLVGFGTFSVSKRKARKGRNPRTGKEIKIPARKVPKFTAGKALKESI
jgi:DNA-binding protein HU-beta